VHSCARQAYWLWKKGEWMDRLGAAEGGGPGDPSIRSIFG
jgi:hypothetical protein